MVPSDLCFVVRAFAWFVNSLFCLAMKCLHSESMRSTLEGSHKLERQSMSRSTSDNIGRSTKYILLFVGESLGRGNFGKHEIEMGGNGGRGWIDLGEAVSNAPFSGVNFIHKKSKRPKRLKNLENSQNPSHPIPSL